MDASTAEFLRGMVNVILGWALGLGSAALIQWRRDRKKIRSRKRAIRRELRETAHRLLGLAYVLAQRQGGFDRPFLEWMQSQVERYEGPNPKDGMLAGVKGLLGNTDKQLAAFAGDIQATVPPQFVPRVDVPYTTLVVADLQEHDPDYAVRALDVLSHIQMFNEARENGLYYSRLTFTPGLTAENHNKATWNALQAEQQLAKRSQIVIDKITELEEILRQDASLEELFHPASISEGIV